MRVGRALATAPLANGAGTIRMLGRASTGLVRRITPAKPLPLSAMEAGGFCRAVTCVGELLLEDSSDDLRPGPDRMPTRILVVSANASRKVRTIPIPDGGIMGGFPGSYAPLTIDCATKIATLTANPAAANNG